MRRVAVCLLPLALLLAAAPALAQTLSVGINSNGTGDATAVEGVEALAFTVKMSATKGSAVTFKWRFVAGTAGADDYSTDDDQPGDKNRTIAAGNTTATFSIAITDDAIHEDTETFEVEIYDASGATISRSKAQVTINVDPDNPDTPLFRVDPASVSVDEDAGSVEIGVEHQYFRSAVGDITIGYAVVGLTATARDDYVASGGLLTFPMGTRQTRTIEILIVDDAYTEGAETFEVRFGSPSAGEFQGGSTATVTIRANDAVAQAAEASITSSPASGTVYGTGETITLSLAMNDTVLVTGRPYVWLDVGGALRRADYAGPIGSATDTMAFSYTVQAGDFDADGVALCASGAACRSIVLNGGTIRAVADELAALLRLPTLAAQGGHRVDAPLPAPTACAAEIAVPSNWALKPSGLAPGDKFRLIFVSSSPRNATSSNIGDYNRFVQNRATNHGHAAIRRYGAGFRAVASTEAVDARDNTCSTGTGVQIRWLNGPKAADNYADFYDGDWDNENPRRANGGTQSQGRVWTGSRNNGTEAFSGATSLALGTNDGDNAANGILGHATHGPLAGETRAKTRNLPLYGLSQVFRVRAAPAATSCPAEIAVPTNWTLKPSTVAVNGRFRLLFVTSQKRNARSSNIGDYNSFVQARAAAGHSAVQPYSAGFRVLGSTQAVNARANTCTRSSDASAAVHWLNGARAASNYTNFYDGNWDTNADRFENGSTNHDSA